MTLFTMFVLIVLQLAILAMLQFNLTGRTTREMGRLLSEQNERLSAAIQVAVQEATTAAREAYAEANSVNLKLERLGLEQKDEKITEKKAEGIDT